MSFINEEITIVNREMWKQVSMIKKRSYRMPRTTNSIESIHGHLNEATPHNNCFWPSLHRIIMTINFQIHRFIDKLHHNYNKIVRDIKRKSFHNPSISEECTFYETTINKCLCVETILYS